MSEYKEKISAYLDDAVEQDELRALVSDSSEVAARYQLIGEALRGEVSDAALNDVSAQVRAALSNEHIEPISTADMRQRDTESLSSAAWNFAHWLRPLSGLAVAASVAVVTVVLVTQEETAPVTATQVANTESAINTPAGTPVVSTSVPGSLVGQSTELATVAPDTTETVRPVVDLRSYLAEHSEFAAQDTVQGRMPYARAVSYESE